MIYDKAFWAASGHKLNHRSMSLKWDHAAFQIILPQKNWAPQ